MFVLVAEAIILYGNEVIVVARKYWGSYELRLRKSVKRGISPKLRSLFRESARASDKCMKLQWRPGVDRKEQKDV